MGDKFRLQRGAQSAILGVERADAAKQLVVMGHFKQSLAGDRAPPQHIFQEGDDIIHPFRPAKGDNQQGIVVVRIGVRHRFDSSRLERFQFSVNPLPVN